jgi:hypothetical protein
MEPNSAEALIELHPRAKVLNVPVNIRLGGVRNTVANYIAAEIFTTQAPIFH